MGAALPIISAIASVAGVAGSLFGGFSEQDAYSDQAAAQREAADAQERAAYESEMLADQNARNLESETLEGVRREDLALEQELGDQRARAAASGLSLEDDEDSMGKVIAANRKEGQTQIDWMETAGMNRADIMRWEGDVGRKTGISQAQFSRDMARITKKRGTTSAWGGLFNAAGKAPGVISAGTDANWW